MNSIFSSRAKARVLAAFVALNLAFTAFPHAGIAQGIPNDIGPQNNNNIENGPPEDVGPPEDNPGQCPSGYTKIDFDESLEWESDGFYESVILVGGPPNEQNQDPDGRDKEFTDVEPGDVIAREAHEISHICVIEAEIDPKIIVKKVTTEETEETFGFDADWGDENTDGEVDFTLDDGDEEDSGDLAFGTYSVEEVDIPDGWSLESVVCESNLDGDEDNTAIELDKNGEVVTCTFTNAKDAEEPEVATLIIEKLTPEEGEAVEFDFSGTGDIGGFSLNGNASTSFELDPGDYTVTEADEAGWELASLSCDVDDEQVDLEAGSVMVSLEEGETVTCEFGNRPEQQEEKEAKIIAHKIVCTDEADVPNQSDWASLEPIDVDTAQDWVDSHASCEFAEGWEFQWGPDSAFDPGDTMTGEAGDPWTTFGPTDSDGMAMTTLTEEAVGDNTHLWFREVLQDGFIPFTHGPNGNSNTDDFTAALFCNTDVLNYDNYDRIDGIAVDETFYCVGWNVPEAPQCVDEMPGWADEHQDVSQGDRKDGGDVFAGRSNPDDALGPADWEPGDSDGFFSLGFGGSITLVFDKFVPDLDGDDISVHEATNGVYPLETAKVEVSQDGSTWHTLTEEARNDNDEGGEDGVTLLDFSETGLAWIKYVRLTDTTDPNVHNNEADGFDLDAVDAVKEVCDEPEDKEDPVCEQPGVNLLENSSFETPEVTDAAGWDIFEDGTSGLAWLVDWFTDNMSGTPDPENGWLELHRGVNGWVSSDGEQHAELDSDWQGPGGPSGEEASVMISQSIPTVPGVEYTIEWDFSPRPNTDASDNILEVLVDGVVAKTNSGAGGGDVSWQSDSHTFTATGNNTEITFRDGGTPNSLGTFVDNTAFFCGEREEEPEPGVIVVEKKVTEGSDTEQQFTFGPSWASDFTLADGQSTSSELAAGNYSVSETVPNGWNDPEVVCASSIEDNETADDIELDEGETVTCTFTNDEKDGGGGGDDDGTIIVEKEVTEGSDQNTFFSFTASWNEVFFLEHGESEDEQLDPGVYSVSETVPDGWDLVNAVCVHGDESTSTPDSIDLSANETVTCTFTNDEDEDGGGDPDPGTIIVQKEVTEGSDTEQQFTFSPSWAADFTLADGQSTSSELAAGNYSVTETVPSGWGLESAVCVSSQEDNETADDIDLDEGETVTCTFTNDEEGGGGGNGDDGGTIIVEKEVTEGSSTTVAFTFSPSWGDDFDLTDGQSENEELDPGTYSVSESVPDGWTLEDAVCVHGDQSTSTPSDIDLAENETVTCTFTNDEEEEEDGGLEITLEKKFSGDDQGFDPSDFSFAIVGDNDVDTTVPHEGSINLLPGTYEVSEIVPEGFDPEDWTIQWSGPRGICVNETAPTGTIIVTEDDVEQLEFATCVADNQFKPDENGGGGGQLGLACDLNTDDPLVDDDDEFELSWSSSGDVDNAFIDPGIGTVAANGTTMTTIDDDTIFTLTVQTLGEEDEVLDEETCEVEVLNRGGGGGGGGTRVDRDGGGGSNDEPEGEVLGEQVSVVPLGAANTGAGGGSLPNVFALFALVLALATMRATRSNESR